MSDDELEYQLTSGGRVFDWQDVPDDYGLLPPFEDGDEIKVRKKQLKRWLVSWQCASEAYDYDRWISTERVVTAHSSEEALFKAGALSGENVITKRRNFEVELHGD